MKEEEGNHSTLYVHLITQPKKKKEKRTTEERKIPINRTVKKKQPPLSN